MSSPETSSHRLSPVGASVTFVKGTEGAAPGGRAVADHVVVWGGEGGVLVNNKGSGSGPVKHDNVASADYRISYLIVLP